MYIQSTNAQPRLDTYSMPLQMQQSSACNAGNPWQFDPQIGSNNQGMLGALVEITRNLTQIVQMLMSMLSGVGGRSELPFEKQGISPFSPMPLEGQPTISNGSSKETSGLGDTLAEWGRKAWSVTKEYGGEVLDWASFLIPSGKIAKWGKKAYEIVKSWF